MPVVTVSGQMGSGAGEIGRMAAESLGTSYIDREVLVEMAQRVGASPEVLATREQQLDTLGERIGHTLRRMLETQAAAGIVGDLYLDSGGIPVLLGRTYEEASATAYSRHEELTDAQYFALLQSVIRDLAGLGSVVILGRGGQLILKDQPGVLRVRIIAPLEVRVERLVRSENIDPHEAERRLRQADQFQAAFFRKYFKSDVQDAMLYDIVLNTAKIPYERAAAVVTNLATLVHSR